MVDVARVKIPTRELVFSIQNEVELPALYGIKIREITRSGVYIAASYYDKSDMTRLVHIYANERYIIAVEEEETESQVLISESIEALLDSLLSLTGETAIKKESLDIPANMLVGLMTSATDDSALKFFAEYSNVSSSFSREFVEDTYGAIGQEHYVAYSNKNEQVSFLKFIKGLNGIWRVSPSVKKGNVLIKPVQSSIYRDSVLYFLKEMIK